MLIFIWGGASKINSPETWKKFISFVPIKKQSDVVDYYWKRINSKNKKISDKFAYGWSLYEASISKKNIKKKDIISYLKTFNYVSLAKLETHYIKNHFFIPTNYIVKNLGKISKIPITLIHGKYDFISNPINSFLLNKCINNSKLILVDAGHSSSEKNIESSLITEINNFF